MLITNEDNSFSLDTNIIIELSQIEDKDMKGKLSYLQHEYGDQKDAINAILELEKNVKSGKFSFYISAFVYHELDIGTQYFGERSIKYLENNNIKVLTPPTPEKSKLRENLVELLFHPQKIKTKKGKTLLVAPFKEIPNHSSVYDAFITIDGMLNKKHIISCDKHIIKHRIMVFRRIREFSNSHPEFAHLLTKEVLKTSPLTPTEANSLIKNKQINYHDEFNEADCQLNSFAINNAYHSTQEKPIGDNGIQNEA